MLSDEITTGSTRTTDNDKKLYAQASHAHNLCVGTLVIRSAALTLIFCSKNPKFKTVFPEYATPELRELPNMGQADLGVAAKNEPPLPKHLGNPDGSTDPNAVGALTSQMQGASLQNGT